MQSFRSSVFGSAQGNTRRELKCPIGSHITRVQGLQAMVSAKRSAPSIFSVNVDCSNGASIVFPVSSYTEEEGELEPYLFKSLQGFDRFECSSKTSKRFLGGSEGVVSTIAFGSLKNKNDDKDYEDDDEDEDEDENDDDDDEDYDIDQDEEYQDDDNYEKHKEPKIRISNQLALPEAAQSETDQSKNLKKPQQAKTVHVGSIKNLNQAEIVRTAPSPEGYEDQKFSCGDGRSRITGLVTWYNRNGSLSAIQAQCGHVDSLELKALQSRSVIQPLSLESEQADLLHDSTAESSLGISTEPIGSVSASDVNRASSSTSGSWLDVGRLASYVPSRLVRLTDIEDPEWMENVAIVTITVVALIAALYVLRSTFGTSKEKRTTTSKTKHNSKAFGRHSK